MAKVSVKRYVEQVRDGSEYKGYLKIAETTLDYELRFDIPIDKLDDSELLDGVHEIRRVFQLTVKRNGKRIELTDEEYGFFFRLLVLFAVEFYNNPRTRENNQGLLGMTLRGKGEISAFGVSSSIGITSSNSYDIPSGLCETLNAPKFGCAINGT